MLISENCIIKLHINRRIKISEIITDALSFLSIFWKIELRKYATKTMRSNGVKLSVAMIAQIISTPNRRIPNIGSRVSFDNFIFLLIFSIVTAIKYAKKTGIINHAALCIVAIITNRTADNNIYLVSFLL